LYNRKLSHQEFSCEGLRIRRVFFVAGRARMTQKKMAAAPWEWAAAVVCPKRN
jgi:hypothetical protein